LATAFYRKEKTMNQAPTPDFIVSHSGMRHVVGEHAGKAHAGRITTCCRFGIRADQEPVEATRDCPWCFAFLELGEDICRLFGDERKVMHLREAADRLRVSQVEIAMAVAGCPRLDWVSAYGCDQFSMSRPVQAAEEPE
jgi:hypothetical protein